MEKNQRGQSEVVGPILLTALVILLVGLLAPMVFAQLDTRDRTNADFRMAVTDESIEVTHGGGDTIPASDIELLVTFDDQSYTLSGTEDGAPDPFQPGHVWTISDHPLFDQLDAGDVMNIRVININSDQELADEEIAIGKPTPSPTATPTPTQTDTPSPTPTDTPTPSATPPAEEAYFEVEIVSTNSPIQAKETLEVTAEISNSGELEATQTIELTVGDLGDSTSLTLDPDQSQEITLSVETKGKHQGTHTATVASESEEDTTDVTIENPGGGQRGNG
ncbi:MAG: type IV pilin, partial [Halodesulfurarchaeum sp.]